MSNHFWPSQILNLKAVAVISKKYLVIQKALFIQTESIYLEFGWNSKSDENIRPSIVSGFEVKTDVATTNLVPSTTKVIFSPGAPIAA